MANGLIENSEAEGSSSWFTALKNAALDIGKTAAQVKLAFWPEAGSTTAKATATGKASATSNATLYLVLAGAAVLLVVLVFALRK